MTNYKRKNFEKITEQFLPKLQASEKNPAEYITCICHDCPKNDYSCPQHCRTLSVKKNVCKQPPCQTHLQTPEECEKQDIKIMGKPTHVIGLHDSEKE